MVGDVHYLHGPWQALQIDPFWKYSIGQVAVQVVLYRYLPVKQDRQEVVEALRHVSQGSLHLTQVNRVLSP